MNRDHAAQLVSALYESWYAAAVRYAYRLTASLELAEDVVQESFMLLYRELRHGRAIGNPKGWTLVVIRRQISKQVRSYQSLDPHNLSLELLDSMPSAMPSWKEPGFEEDDATRLLAILTSRELEVILLRMEALKYREIAGQLGINPNSVNTLLARALRKLQKAVAERRSCLPLKVQAGCANCDGLAVASRPTARLQARSPGSGWSSTSGCRVTTIRR